MPTTPGCKYGEHELSACPSGAADARLGSLLRHAARAPLRRLQACLRTLPTQRGISTAASLLSPRRNAIAWLAAAIAVKRKHVLGFIAALLMAGLLFAINPPAAATSAARARACLDAFARLPGSASWHDRTPSTGSAGGAGATSAAPSWTSSCVSPAARF